MGSANGSSELFEYHEDGILRREALRGRVCPRSTSTTPVFVENRQLRLVGDVRRLRVAFPVDWENGGEGGLVHGWLVRDTADLIEIDECDARTGECVGRRFSISSCGEGRSCRFSLFYRKLIFLNQVNGKREDEEALQQHHGQDGCLEMARTGPDRWSGSCVPGKRTGRPSASKRAKARKRARGGANKGVPKFAHVGQATAESREVQTYETVEMPDQLEATQSLLGNRLTDTHSDKTDRHTHLREGGLDGIASRVVRGKVNDVAAN